MAVPSKFRVIRGLGGGFFGEVWLVEDAALRQQRAVKLIDLADIVNPGNIFAEAQALAAIRHENVVQIFETGNSDDNSAIYIAMEYLPGGTAADCMNGSFVPMRRAVEIGLSICRGLAAVHAAGLIHRDVKPSNIFISATGVAKLGDFGFATASRGYSPRTQGYNPHFPPEVLTGARLNQAADVYALGLTLYRLINGPGYFSTSVWGQNEMDAVATGKLPNRSAFQPFVPPALRRVLRKAIAVNPTDRFPDAVAFHRALSKIGITRDWTCDDDDVRITYESTGAAGRPQYQVAVRLEGPASNLEVRQRVTGDYRRNAKLSQVGISEKDARRGAEKLLQQLSVT